MNETKGSSSWGTAVAGGVIGSVLTAALLLFAAPHYLSSRIVRHGMLSDPQILADAADALRDSQFAPVLNANRTAIETPFGSSWKGSSKPDVTLVEFFDYRCPYCKQVVPALDALLAKDKQLRFVYKEFPVLGPDSVHAARAALAAGKQGKYEAMHRALMAIKGQLDEPAIMKVAASVGLDVERLKTDMAAPETDRALKANVKLAEALDIHGTPGFVIGDEIVPGAVGLDELKRLIEAARRGK